MSLADDTYDLTTKELQAEAALGFEITTWSEKVAGVDHFFIFLNQQNLQFEFVDVEGALTALDAMMGDPSGAAAYNKQKHIEALQAQIDALGD